MCSHIVLPARDHKWAFSFFVLFTEQSPFSFLLEKYGPHKSFLFKYPYVWYLTPVNFYSLPRELKPKKYWITANTLSACLVYLSVHLFYLFSQAYLVCSLCMEYYIFLNNAISLTGFTWRNRWYWCDSLNVSLLIIMKYLCYDAESSTSVQLVVGRKCLQLPFLIISHWCSGFLIVLPACFG